MKYAIIAGCGAFAVASTLTLSAQTPPRPQTPQPSASTPSRTDDRTQTVTGCLKAWDSTMTGPAAGSTASTPGTATGSGSASMAGKFVLTNVRDDATMAGSTSAKPDTSSTTGAARSGNTTSNDTKQYVLSAESGVNLQAHVNHQVRVTGKVTDMADHSAMGTTRPGETTRPGTTPDPGRSSTDRDNMGKAWPTMNVSSVTMISASCTGATR